jgi:stalled ribosome rescue protein Dom34
LNFNSSFRIKIIAAELIIRYEIGDFDYLEERIKQVKRRYKDTLNNTRNIREFLLLKIIQKLIYTQRIKQDQELVDDIMLLLSKIPVEQAENDDVVNYNRWLLKKLA